MSKCSQSLYDHQKRERQEVADSVAWEVQCEASQQSQ